MLTVQTLFHEGELLVQERVGERDTATANVQFVGDRIPGGAKQFIRKQGYCVLNGRGSQSKAWASFLAGPKDFVQADDKSYLRLPDELGVLENTPR